MMMQMLALVQSASVLHGIAPRGAGLLLDKLVSVAGGVSLSNALKQSAYASRDGLAKALSHLAEECEAIGLPVSLAAIERAMAALEQSGADFPLAPHEVENLWMRVYDEVEKVKFFRVPETLATYYELDEQKWPIVGKLPQVTEDVDEAGKCLACGRFTASVFHLMRVMELALQQMATALGASVGEKDAWLTILKDRLEPAINALPESTPAERERKKQFQQSRAHLHAVRLAWRNDTMHPKATYTQDEAIVLVEHVRTFTSHLVQLLP
jgi:hypothetical protein